jgi:hypothetical protein
MSTSLWDTNETAVAAKCQHDCDNGYGEKGLRVACRLGCQSQQQQRRHHSPEHEVMSTMLDFAWHRQLFQPLHHLGRYCSHMYNNVVSYVVQDQQDGSTLILQFQVQPETHGRRVITRGDEAKRDDGVEQSTNPLKHYANLIYQRGHKWLNCVERRAGLPYWSLVAILFLSLFFMCWVCCSSCDEKQPTQKKHVFKEPIPAHSDERFLQPLEKPPPYFLMAVPTYEEVEEAAPLPQKKPLLDID